MSTVARILGGALLFGAGALVAPQGVGSALAQADTTAPERPTLAALRQTIEGRYQVLPIQDGIVLIPRYGNAGVQAIELSGESIAIDGAQVTVAELRAGTADDADAILQLSYLDVGTRRVLFGIGASPAAADSLVADTAAAAAAASAADDEEGKGIDVGSRGDRVRIGGSVVVREGETIDGDVVAVGGSVRVDGRVTGDVTAVGGPVHLGPNAVVEGDVTAAGGQVYRAAGAEIHGATSETTWGGPDIRIHRAMGWEPFEGVAGFVTTIMWIVFLGLLSSLIYLLARKPVERMEYRAATSLWKAAAIGLLGQILFLPVLVLTTVILAISIVGIPLLIAIPFAILALMVGTLIGFTAVARVVGGAAEDQFGWRHESRYMPLLVGVGILMAVPFFAAALGIAGGPLGVFAVILSILGFVIQYVAWTIGFGVLLMTRFGTRTSWSDEPGPAATAPPAPPADGEPAAPEAPRIEPPRAPEGPGERA